MEGLLLDPHMVRQKSSVVSLLIREIIPLMRAIPIWPNYLLKISPPNTTNTLGLGLQHIQFRRNTHIQSISFYLWPSQIYVLLTCKMHPFYSNSPSSSVFCCFYFGKSLRRIAASSLNVWQKSPVNTSGLELFFVRFLMTDLFSFFPSCFSLHRFCVSRNLFHLRYPVCWCALQLFTVLSYSIFYFCRDGGLHNFHQ